LVPYENYKLGRKTLNRLDPAHPRIAETDRAKKLVGEFSGANGGGGMVTAEKVILLDTPFLCLLFSPSPAEPKDTPPSILSVDK
jgi:hypothetical protein